MRKKCVQAGWRAAFIPFFDHVARRFILLDGRDITSRDLFFNCLSGPIASRVTCTGFRFLELLQAARAKPTE